MFDRREVDDCYVKGTLTMKPLAKIRSFTPIVMAAVFFCFVGPASAQVCSLEHFAEMEDSLPDAIIFDDNDNIFEVVENSYNCKFQSIDEFGMSTTAKTSDGKEIGNISGISIDNINFGVNAVVGVDKLTGVAEKEINLPIEAIEKWDQGGLSTNLAGTSVENAPPPSTNSIFFNLNSNVQMIANTVGGNFFSNLFLPPKRQRLRIWSEPTKASVTLGDQQIIGETELSILVRRSNLQTLELHKEGYRSCSFTDGNYFDSGLQNSAAFGCTLQPDQ